MSYFTPLSERELLNPHWDSIVLLQDGPVEMCYTWNEARTIERRKRQESGLTYPIPAHLFVPDRAASSAQYV